MSEIIRITDDFDLEKIIDCGQCFRAKFLEDGSCRFISGEKILYIRTVDECEYEISCDFREWKDFWENYFDLKRDYASIRNHLGDGDDEFIESAIKSGRGLRILHQDEWEMLITFIISQRKSIPAIATSVEALCTNFGGRISAMTLRGTREEIYTFPSAEALVGADGDVLAGCGLGYRLPYIRDAANKVHYKEIDLEALKNADDENLFNELMKIRGVGKKVANCVCLFGYNRCGRAPVDVWIERAINEEWSGVNRLEDFGPDAGIVQQYIFYFEKHKNI